jgi:hypothetical protein
VGPAGKVLLSRLKNHVDSIRGAKNLKVEDFFSLSCFIFSFRSASHSDRPIHSHLVVNGPGGLGTYNAQACARRLPS